MKTQNRLRIPRILKSLAVPTRLLGLGLAVAILFMKNITPWPWNCWRTFPSEAGLIPVPD
jgi:hypothetical protein